MTRPNKYYNSEEYKNGENIDAELFTEAYDKIKEDVDSVYDYIESVIEPKITKNKNDIATQQSVISSNMVTDINTTLDNLNKLDTIVSPVKVTYNNSKTIRTLAFNNMDVGADLDSLYYYCKKEYYQSTINNTTKVEYENEDTYKEIEGILVLYNDSEGTITSIITNITLPKYDKIMNYSIKRTGILSCIKEGNKVFLEDEVSIFRDESFSTNATASITTIENDRLESELTQIINYKQVIRCASPVTSKTSGSNKFSKGKAIAYKFKFAYIEAKKEEKQTNNQEGQTNNQEGQTNGETND